ncbi:hypothetical protein HNP46_000101 [Pseudomonas nitritireducens]|uniref:Uncharacterized protein n=1 Tax=Pseudomonas nitroreducens TaxID=46680 RepID=A0A7W7NZH3_PSENT|nr:hypothetical protein [Pseudomonas nitritireducens]MBB4861290.1 hypothetical protein [Pseudomonas nitritireducens]
MSAVSQFEVWKAVTDLNEALDYLSRRDSDQTILQMIQAVKIIHSWHASADLSVQSNQIVYAEAGAAVRRSLIDGFGYLFRHDVLAQAISVIPDPIAIGGQTGPNDGYVYLTIIREMESVKQPDVTRLYAEMRIELGGILGVPSDPLHRREPQLLPPTHSDEQTVKVTALLSRLLNSLLENHYRFDPRLLLTQMTHVLVDMSFVGGKEGTVAAIEFIQTNARFLVELSRQARPSRRLVEKDCDESMSAQAVILILSHEFSRNIAFGVKSAAPALYGELVGSDEFCALINRYTDIEDLIASVDFKYETMQVIVGQRIRSALWEHFDGPYETFERLLSCVTRKNLPDHYAVIKGDLKNGLKGVDEFLALARRPGADVLELSEMLPTNALYLMKLSEHRDSRYATRDYELVAVGAAISEGENLLPKVGITERGIPRHLLKALIRGFGGHAASAGWIAENQIVPFLRAPKTKRSMAWLDASELQALRDAAGNAIDNEYLDSIPFRDDSLMTNRMTQVFDM